MPFGDSLTVGYGTDGGYRKALYYKMAYNGYGIEYVGSSRENVKSLANITDCHEGHANWKIDDFIENSREIFEQSVDPDVILMMVGSEDMQSDDYLQAIGKWESLLVKVLEYQPYTYVFISNLLPLKNDALTNARIETHFNSKLPSIVNKYKAMGHKVEFVNLAIEITPQHYSDKKHLNKKGYKMIAKAWSRKLRNFFTPEGDSYPPEIIKAEQSTDASTITLTFSKPISDESAEITNFELGSGLDIVNTILASSSRQIILTLPQEDRWMTRKDSSNTVSIVGSIRDRTEEGHLLENGQEVAYDTFWRFIVLSDWHSAEKYVFSEQKSDIRQDKIVISHISETYGGDFVMIPGDTNNGGWTKKSFMEKFRDFTGLDLDFKDIVLRAGRNCYTGMLKSFRLSGYSRVLLAHGDHEAGDNPWKVGSFKSIAQPEYRKALGEAFNVDFNDNRRYDGMIGDVPQRPIGTQFSETAYAYVHKNVLIVTIDPFYQESPDVEIATGETVAMRVTGGQLEWLDKVLAEAKKDLSIKHIFVQGHVPVLHPVRKSRSSGQMMEGEERSDFWKTLRKHDVDIYFTGEVHLNTVTKDKWSNVVQIASRGNYFSSFLNVDITDDEIDIISNNEVGDKRMKYNLNYEESGRLTIKKKGNQREIVGAGQLTLTDTSAALIYFDFEKLSLLRDRPVLGLAQARSYPAYVEPKPVMDFVPVQGINCFESLPNEGGFGVDYDAAIANIQLVDGIDGMAGRFSGMSRAAIWSMGPHFEGREVAYSLWFKTGSVETEILIAYEGFWIKKTALNLRLRNGRPEIIYSADQRLMPNDSLFRLNNNQWHHIVVSNPKDDSYLSELEMYVDGRIVPTMIEGLDKQVNFPNGGVISLGGFGHGRTSSSDNPEVRDGRDGFLKGRNFVGEMDEVKIFARSISADEVKKMYEEHRPDSHTDLPSMTASSSPSIAPPFSSSSNPSNHPSQMFSDILVPSIAPTVSTTDIPSEIPSISSSSPSSSSQSPSEESS